MVSIWFSSGLPENVPMATDLDHWMKPPIIASLSQGNPGARRLQSAEGSVQQLRHWSGLAGGRSEFLNKNMDQMMTGYWLTNAHGCTKFQGHLECCSLSHRFATIW